MGQFDVESPHQGWANLLDWWENTEKGVLVCPCLDYIVAAEVALFRHRQALSSDSVERLPVFNKSALRHYQTSMEADDWSMPSKDPRRRGKQE